MKHEEIKVHLAAYALNSLDERESSRVARHLARCNECRAEVEGYIETAARVGGAVEPAEPSPAMKSRVLSRLRSEVEREGLVSRAGTRLLPAWSWLTLLLAAGLIAVTVALAVAVSLLNGRVDDVQERNQTLQASISELGEQNEQLAQLVEEQGVLGYLIALPGTQTISLRGTQEAPSAWGVLMIAKSSALSDYPTSYGVMAVEGLQKLQADQTYQIWLWDGDTKVSGGVFNVDDRGWALVTVKVNWTLVSFRSVGITVEPAGKKVMGGDF